MKHGSKIYKQGDCDGLCGIYAIVNALSALCPEIDKTHAKALFRALVASLAAHRKAPLSVVCDGMHGTLLRSMLTRGETHVNQRFSAQITRSRLNLPASRATTRQLCERLRDALEDDHVAILMIDGSYSHWTVAYEVTDKTIRLLDSTGMKYLLRSRCTFIPTSKGHQLFRDEIILVRRQLSKE